MGLGFMKAEGAGNDLIVVDGREVTLPDPSGAAVRLCERHTGVGGDGLMVVGRGAFVRMFNPDGTEDFCGNGVRCVAAWLFARGEAEGNEMVLFSPQGRHAARVEREGARGFMVEVELVQPDFRAGAIPVAGAGPRVLEYPLAVDEWRRPVSCVRVGTAHTVVFVEEEPADEVFARVSARIERHEMFPERTNVLWCRVTGDDVIEMRVWERGVGETLSCGTGACAAAAVGRTLGRCGDRVEVAMRGGRGQTMWDGAGLVKLRGLVRLVFEGELGTGD